MRVELYTKPGCSLCEAAKAVLEDIQGDIDFELREIDIRHDEALFERYRFDIPVVVVGGRTYKHRIYRTQIVQALSGG